VSSDTVIGIKLVLAALLGLFLLLRLRRRPHPSPGAPAAHPHRRRRARQLFLAALALLSLANFLHLGYFHTRYEQHGWLDKRAFVHLWDLYHYYLGAKYFDELGYGSLYVATVAADAEDAGGGRLREVARVRNLEGTGFLTREQVLARAAAVKTRFSPGRWRQFRADVGAFTRRLPAAVLPKILLDHGYNPTPAWNTTAAFLANRVPVERLFSLALIDVALLLAAAAAIGAAFGLESALLAAAFFGINAYAGFSITGGSFLRYDWLLALVAAACLLRRRRYAGAGLCLSYAALVRVFPALFLGALACKALVETVRCRAVPPRYARLFLAFLAGSALLAGYGCLSARGADAWRQFGKRIAAHHRTLTANSIGFSMVFLYDGTWESADAFADAYGTTGVEGDALVNKVKRAEARTRRAAFLLSCAAVLALAALVAVGRPDGEALAWGAAPVFMLLTLSDYYYVFLVVCAVTWYRGSGRRPLPLLLLIATQALVLWIRLAEGFPLRATALASGVFFLFLLTLLSYELLLTRHRIARCIPCRGAGTRPTP
jgi:hypothetical protein